MYHFLVTQHRRIPAAIVRQIDEICEKHGATFVQIKEPGSGWKSWATGPNRGEPFDSALARAVRVDLETAGLSAHVD